MIKNFGEIKKQLEELAPAINSFKSEAVQLRIVELVFKGEYGQGGDENAGHSSGGSPSRRTRSKQDSRIKAASSEAPAKRARKKGGSSGPVATLNELIDGNFFTKHRILGEIIEHCKNHKAKTFRPDQLSGPLARTVRSERLKRQKNADGQFEYWKP
jgi:hypothetical protein